jgi:hypothetical protein
MRRASVWSIAAVAVHLVGWSAPVVRDYAGWQAFRVALGPLWPLAGVALPTLGLMALGVASAATNLLFAGAVLVLATRLRHRVRMRALAGALMVATAVDLLWPFSAGEHWTELEVGYYAWLASFPLLALAALAAARGRPAS